MSRSGSRPGTSARTISVSFSTNSSMGIPAETLVCASVIAHLPSFAYEGNIYPETERGEQGPWTWAGGAAGSAVEHGGVDVAQPAEIRRRQAVGEPAPYHLV